MGYRGAEVHGAGREQQASQGVLDAVAHGGLVLTLLGGSAVSLFAVVCVCVRGSYFCC